MILDDIVQVKKIELKKAKQIRKIAELKAKARNAAPLKPFDLRQKDAVSISWASRTTSQSRLPSARRASLAFMPPTAGFWPMQNSPFMLPSFIIRSMGWNE